MSEILSLQELYAEADVLEDGLRSELGDRPKVKNLKDVPIPYVVKQHVLMDEGTHNGKFYQASVLRPGVKQHQGLSIFADHHDSPSGGTTQTWIGDITNPTWSPESNAILGDVNIIDPTYAMAIAYGAKFGLSGTIDVDCVEVKGKRTLALDPRWLSYSLVLDPAVRQTMLNERELPTMGNEIVDAIKEGLAIVQPDLKGGLEPALAKLDGAILRASAMKDTSLVTELRQLKAMLSRTAGGTYPYPQLEEFDAFKDEVRSMLNELKPAGNEDKDPKDEQIVQLSAEKTALEDKLSAYAKEELTNKVNSIVDKEMVIGLLTDANKVSRTEALSEMSVVVLEELEATLDRIITELNVEPDTTTPAPSTIPATDAEPNRQALQDMGDKSDRRILDMMIKEQSSGGI